MTLLSGAALAALVLAIPLVALHLRRRKPPRRAVGSLLAWRDLPAAGGGGARRIGRPPLPLLLALQLLALVALVVALARPVSNESATTSAHVYVVDQSMWMGADAGATARIDVVRGVLRERLAELPADAAVRIVGARATPAVLFEGKAADAGGALRDLRAGPGPANLTAALRLAAGLRAGAGDRIALLRAPEEAAPAVRGGSSYEDLEVGEPVADASLSGASAHCDRLGAEACEVFVRVADSSGTARTLPVRVAISGEPVHTVPVEVPTGEAAALVFTVPPGATVRMSLASGDGLAADDTAFVSVPRPGGESITLVGNRTRALPLARALASVPGVKLRLRTPQTYRPTDPGTSDLLVLDDFVPPGGLPQAPALLLVNPPRFPSHGSQGKMRDSRLSGTEAASPLLEGADISALTIGAGAARRLALPASMTAAAWSADGPLIASGTDGGRRVAVMSFEPSESNLPQLGAFPALIDNIVAWSQRLAPAAVAAGTPFALAEPPGTRAASLRRAPGGAARQLRRAAGTEIPVTIASPGNYVVTLRGPWGTRELTLAVNPGPAATPGAPVDLDAPPPPAHPGHTDLWPWLLAAALLALVLEALYAWWREPDRRTQRSRRRIAVGLQVASVVLVAIALFDPTVGSKPPPTTLVLDRSLSIGAGASEAESEWLAAHRGCGAECRVVQFGGGAEFTGAGADLLPQGAGGRVEGRETDLAAALELALARTPRGGRVVLLSDGRQTTGEPLGLAAAARERGVTVDTVALTRQPADAAVTRLQAPEALHAGDPLSLEVTVRSTVEAPAVLTVRRDGVAVGHQRVSLGTGDNPYLFSVRVPQRPGSYGYEVEVRSAGDSRPRNDALGTTVRVQAPPKALVAAADGSAAADLLRADGFDVTAVAPGALPTSAAGYRGVDAVVLEDISAAELGKSRATAIGAAVRTQALGLLAFGGDRSFSLGKYYKSPLQNALPVKSLVPGKLQRKNVAVELILDRSGSMINEVGGVPKIAMAQAAARGALDFLLKHRDQVGIVTFEVKAKSLVPLTRVEPGNVRKIERKINNIPANGGTNVYRGLAEGVKEIERSQAKERHIILLTDGISEPGTYAELLPGLKKGKISVATVALGAEADFKLLKQIAADTGGNYYRTENARDLPKIFDKETRLNTRTVRLRGEIGVSAGDPSPITGSLVGEHLPPLRGNVVTELKPGAEAALLGQDKDHPPDPVLAQWQYGSGRAAVWTPGLAPAWAGEWLGHERLFQDAGRWVERGVAPPPLTPSLAPGDQRVLEVAPTDRRGQAIVLETLRGTLTSPAGKTIPLRFEESAPGRWTAPLPALPAGEYAYALASVGAGSLTGTLAVPYPAELRLGRIDTTPLGPLAAASAGTTLSAADPGAIEGSSHRIWWLFAALALACFLLGAGLRLLSRGWGEEDDSSSRQDSSDRDADAADLEPHPV